MPKVFISHRTSDMVLATKLADEISNAGHSVWLDDKEIGIGDSIVGRINEGLSGADYFVLCYSLSGVMSPWMITEWTNALAMQLDGYGIKLLPVRLSGGDPPAILAGIKYADLVADWATGTAALLRAIR